MKEAVAAIKGYGQMRFLCCFKSNKQLMSRGSSALSLEMIHTNWNYFGLLSCFSAKINTASNSLFELHQHHQTIYPNSIKQCQNLTVCKKCLRKKCTSSCACGSNCFSSTSDCLMNEYGAAFQTRQMICKPNYKGSECLVNISVQNTVDLLCC
jgi:hypothetical protein